MVTGMVAFKVYPIKKPAFVPSAFSYFPNKSLCVPVRDNVKTSKSFSIHTDTEISCGSHECQLLSLLLHLYICDLHCTVNLLDEKFTKKSIIIFWRNSLLNVFEAVKQNLTSTQCFGLQFCYRSTGSACIRVYV